MSDLQTDRTILRRFRASDLPNMIRLESDAEIMRFTPSRVPLDEEKIKERLTAQIEKQKELAPLGIWAAELKDSFEFVGWFMLIKAEFKVPELGFMLVREQWGKGLATEIARTLLEHGLQKLNYPGIAAVTDFDNSKSIHILQKLGFSQVGKKTKFDKVLNRECELFIFGKGAVQVGFDKKNLSP